MSWRCKVCGYIHEGDEPPEVCPVCGVGPEEFEAFAEPELAETVPGDALDVVVVGGGAAGMAAVEAICKLTANVNLTLVCEENVPPYWRINLSRLLAGEVDESELTLRPPSWFEEKKVKLILGTPVQKIDRKQKKLLLAGGEELSYDRLLLATGAEAWKPPIEGIDLPGVHVLRTLEDAQQLLKLAQSDVHCVALGGGILGLELAGALARRGVHVLLVEQMEWLMQRQLPKICADRLREVVETLGIKLRLAAQVNKIEKNGHFLLHFADG
ncbi:MAG: pyridine nucleotide-disulfide oxidoreductase, partial [Lentisphaerae bacterium]